MSESPAQGHSVDRSCAWMRGEWRKEDEGSFWEMRGQQEAAWHLDFNRLWREESTPSHTSRLVGPGVEVSLVRKGHGDSSLCHVWLSWSGMQKVAEVTFLVLEQGSSC